MAALSSTGCVLRLLTDRAEVESAYGRVASGILLVQDVAVVPMMLLITVLAGGGSIAAIVVKLLLYLLAAAGLIAAFFVVFNLLAPKVLRLPSWRRNRDLPSLLAALMALGSAWAAEYFGLSPALGAFSAGVLLAVSPFVNQIRADVRPLGTVMVTLFFASIGMFGDPVWLLGHLAPVTALVAAILVVKTVIVAVLAWLFGYSFRYALAAGLCLAQVGEFSFVLANIARTTGAEPIMGEETFRAVVSATIITLLLTPYLVAGAPIVGAIVERWLLRAPPWQRRRGVPTAVAELIAEPAPDASPEPARYTPRRVLLIGFGPAGQRVAEGLLDAYRNQMTVVDLNPDNLRVAQRYGLPAHLGDATRPEILEHAGIDGARVVVITTPAPQTGRQIVHQIRALAPDAVIVARSRYHVFHWELLLAGAQVVVDEEDLVGRRLARVVQQCLHQPLLPG
jgi:CPA2 family monovalent cation:H+ antiporter-2